MCLPRTAVNDTIKYISILQNCVEISIGLTSSLPKTVQHHILICIPITGCRPNEACRGGGERKVQDSHANVYCMYLHVQQYWGKDYSVRDLTMYVLFGETRSSEK